MARNNRKSHSLGFSLRFIGLIPGPSYFCRWRQKRETDSWRRWFFCSLSDKKVKLVFVNFSSTILRKKDERECCCCYCKGSHLHLERTWILIENSAILWKSLIIIEYTSIKLQILTQNVEKYGFIKFITKKHNICYSIICFVIKQTK